ncbi:hypothetical protein SAMN06296386_104100 [Lachnospiraceae bacterium]|nr:hypothetical protein SAMN06296386_104100 [Lachnospiraceae bacterium]
MFRSVSFVKSHTNHNNKLSGAVIRRRRRMKRRGARFLVISAVLLPIGIALGAIRSYADPATTITTGTKYYKSIVVMPGDTLAEIAEINLSPEYSSAEEYMEEVRQMNHLDFDYSIHSGEYLLIPYYR